MQDSNFRRKWEIAMCRTFGELDRLCEKHFKAEDINFNFQTTMSDGSVFSLDRGVKSLKANAIPTMVCVQ